MANRKSRPTELLRELASVVLRYDVAIEEVARQRGTTAPGAWTVNGVLSERLDALYFEMVSKAREAFGEFGDA